MKVLTISRHFPKGHPKSGEPTWFVEKIWNCFREEDFSLPDRFIAGCDNYATLLKDDEHLTAIKIREMKHHTLRSGNRWQVGDTASLRIWLDKPYRSKQIEFAQVEVKKVWPVTIIFDDVFNPIYTSDRLLPTCEVAKNDGLECDDFAKWFAIHPKKEGSIFQGQIICWSHEIDYTPDPISKNS